MLRYMWANWKNLGRTFAYSLLGGAAAVWLTKGILSLVSVPEAFIGLTDILTNPVVAFSVAVISTLFYMYLEYDRIPEHE